MQYNIGIITFNGCFSRISDCVALAMLVHSNFVPTSSVFIWVCFCNNNLKKKFLWKLVSLEGTTNHSNDFFRISFNSVEELVQINIGKIIKKGRFVTVAQTMYFLYCTCTCTYCTKNQPPSTITPNSSHAPKNHPRQPKELVPSLTSLALTPEDKQNVGISRRDTWWAEATLQYKYLY